MKDHMKNVNAVRQCIGDKFHFVESERRGRKNNWKIVSYDSKNLSKPPTLKQMLITFKSETRVIRKHWVEIDNYEVNDLDFDSTDRLAVLEDTASD